MECLSAEELQARLAIRALWRSDKDSADDGGADGGSARGKEQSGLGGDTEQGTSLLHRQLRAEVEGALKGSLQRRLERLERKIKLLCDDGGAAASTDGGSPQPSAGAPQSKVDEAPESLRPLAKAIDAALTAASLCVKPPAKAFAPSRRQSHYADPPEKRDDIVQESFTMKVTLSNLKKILSSRHRQTVALREQLGTCEEMLRECAARTEAVTGSSRELAADPGQLEQTFRDQLRRRRARVAELAGNVANSQDQVKHYTALAQQQRAFFLQSERIAVSGGQDAIRRHPAGIVVLVPQPQSLQDEKPESWDVGSAIANPYICDSWPFEPNVLAQTAPKECSMSSWQEETEEDLREESRRASLRPGALRLRLSLPGRGDEDDEGDGYDERYTGPSETSRSL